MTPEQIAECLDALPKVGEPEDVFVCVKASTLRALLDTSTVETLTDAARRLLHALEPREALSAEVAEKVCDLEDAIIQQGRTQEKS